MLYLHFDESGRFVGKTSEPGDGFYSFPVPEGREVGERYSVINGELVDNYPDLSDEQFIEQYAQEQAAAAAAAQADEQPAGKVSKLSKLEFMERFTDEELAAIYTAAKQSVQVEVWVDKLKLAEFVDLVDPRTRNGVINLEADGLLAKGRADEILAF